MRRLALALAVLAAAGCEPMAATKPTNYTEVATSPTGTLPSGAAKVVRPAAAYRNEGWSENEEYAVNNHNWNGQNNYQWQVWHEAVARNVAAVTVVSSDIESGTSSDYVCDGTADDVQIQAAIDAVNADGGGTVFLSRGEFKLAAAVVLKGSVRLVGAGFGTVLTAVPTGAMYMLDAQGADGWSVESLKLDGDKASHAQEVTCIRVDAAAGTADYWQIRRVWCTGAQYVSGATYGHGVYVDNATLGSIAQCRFDSADSSDVTLTANSESIRVESSWFGLSGAGVIDSGAGNLFRDLTVVNTTTGPGAQFAGTDTIVSRCLFGALATYGVQLSGSRIQFRNNTVSTCQTHGIVLNGALGCSVTDNHVVDVSQAATNTSDFIQLVNGQRNIVTGNRTRSTTGTVGRYGIYEDPANIPLNTLCYGNYVLGSFGTAGVLMVAGPGDAAPSTGSCVTHPHLLWDQANLQWVGDSTMNTVNGQPDASNAAGGWGPNAPLGAAPQRAAQLANY